MGMALDLACHVNVLVPDLDDPRTPAALGALAEAGYRRVVLPPLDPATANAARYRSLFAEAGLSPITLAGQGPGADVSSMDDAERDAGMDALRAALDLTVALGSDQMNGVPYGLFGSPGEPVDERRRDRAARAVGAIADEAHGRGVMMTFEVLNRYETAMVNTAAQAMDFVERSGSEHLKIHLDSFHMAIEESDVVEAIRTALPRLGYLELGQSGRGDLATGAVDIPRLVAETLAAGYRGRWGVEAFARSILAAPTANALAIWREPFVDALALARAAVGTIAAGIPRGR